MSGIEVIGLILGAFPLAISALEHYRESCKALDLLANFEKQWCKSLNDIKDEQLFFILNLKILLLPLAAADDISEEDLQALLADPTSPKWTETDIDAALKRRLGHSESHTRFIEISQELQLLIWKLLRLIGVDKPRLQAKLRASNSQNDGSVAPSKQKLMAAALKDVLKTSFEYRKEQLKFGLGESKREDIINEIRKNNKKLERLMEKSDKVASFQTAKTAPASRQAVKSLLQYWRHADRVYALIYRSWGCSCQDKHCAHLWLQHRTSSAFEFKLLVMWSPHNLGHQQIPPWNQQGLRITSFQGTVLQAHVTVMTPSLTSALLPMSGSSTPAAGGVYPEPKRRRIRQKSVRMAVSNPLSSALVAAKSTQLSNYCSSRDAVKNDQLLQEIKKLCVAMSACDMNASCLGALADHDKGDQYSVFCQPDQKLTAAEITLAEVLHDKSKPRLRKRSDRYRIALAVASSHLQLHSTRWAGKQWDAHDIRFPQSTQDMSVMFDRPYVSADFNNGVNDKHKAAKKTDRSFACLGIMLLELVFGSCLDDHELWQQPGFANNRSKPLYRLMVAKQWADTVEDEAGAEFSAAIMWCLNESPTTLLGDQWRKDLADRVVLPLQNCCDWIGGKCTP